ncbi:MAG: tail fiber protein [Planctomycetes bacterium]|nr:tail fiber protein [Planctomycetota bacterium]
MTEKIEKKGEELSASQLLAVRDACHAWINRAMIYFGVFLTALGLAGWSGYSSIKAGLELDLAMQKQEVLDRYDKEMKSAREDLTAKSIGRAISEDELARKALAQELTGVPVGAVTAFSGPANNIPTGWLLCDGRAIRMDEYAELYAAIGVTHGNGAGNTAMFNIPDLRGQFLRGVDSGAGIDLEAAKRTSGSGAQVGDVVGSRQRGSTAMPLKKFETNEGGAHNHSLFSPRDEPFVRSEDLPRGSSNSLVLETAIFWSNYTSRKLVGENINLGSVSRISIDREYGYPSNESVVTETAGAHSHIIGKGGDAETRPTNVSVNWIIKSKP